MFLSNDLAQISAHSFHEKKHPGRCSETGRKRNSANFRLPWITQKGLYFAIDCQREALTLTLEETRLGWPGVWWSSGCQQGRKKKQFKELDLQFYEATNPISPTEISWTWKDNNIIKTQRNKWLWLVAISNWITVSYCRSSCAFKSNSKSRVV